ncbi:unnamed protein product [Calypogeia fissa]
MSLKQRAVQCSGIIPADQYVPVYSRPHRTNQMRWHEEIAPIVPKPTLDDPYDTRTHSIHEAVKQWLESSPNSVIGPLYRTRSPSSGSPPSNGGESLEKTPARAEIQRWESTMERFYDVGSGGLSPMKQSVSPRQVSIEQSVALQSGSSNSSPANQVDSSTPPWENSYMNQAQDAAVGTAALPQTQKSGAKSPESEVLQGNDEESRKASDASLPSSPEQSSTVNEEEASPETEEGTRLIRRQGGKKRNIAELKCPDQDHSYGLSGSSLSDFTGSRASSRQTSREFDNELALAVQEIEKADSFSCASVNSSVGEPVVLLKPPRVLEQTMAQSSEHSLSTVAMLPPPLARTASARDDRNSAAMSLLTTLPRAASAREDQNSAARRASPLDRAADLTQNSNGVLLGGTKASTISEIVPADSSPDDGETGGSSNKENISDGAQQQQGLPANSVEQKQLGLRATLNKIDESCLELGSKTTTTSNAPPLMTLKEVLQNEAILEAHLEKARSGNYSPLVSNSPAVGALAGGGRSSRRTPSRAPSAFSSDRGSIASAANSVPSQYIYKVSPLHQMARKANRSKRQSANAVTPADTQQLLKRDKSSKSTKSCDRESRAASSDLDPAKLEDLRLKADAWETAKNATILNRYKREESKIHLWEERMVAKATINLSKLESDLEKTRVKAMEKMKYEVEQAHKRAEEMKAQAEAKRAEKAAKAAVQAQVIRVLGKTPLSCFCS